jgi:hypothetical protein
MAKIIYHFREGFVNLWDWSSSHLARGSRKETVPVELVVPVR